MFDKEIIECQYSAILSGFSSFLVKKTLLFIKHISPVEIFEAHSLLLTSRARYRSDGLMSEVEILRDCAKKGLWSAADDATLNDLEKRVQTKRKLLGNLALPSQAKQVEGEIRLLLEDVKKKKSIKMGYLTNSWEYRLQQEKVELITYLSIYKTTQKRLWKNFQSFEDEDRDYIFEIMDASSNALNGINSKIIRYIARTTDARHRLKSPISSQSSIFLLELKQWCEFYDSIFQMGDPPPDHIIEDDDKLDGWLMSRRKSVQKSVNTNEGFVSHPGATKEDMEILGGVGREDIIKASKGK